MEFSDLGPIITLLSEQEARFVKKIDEVHDIVTETNNKITDQNGRLRNVEIKVAQRDTFCKLRETSVDEKLDKAEPTIKVTRLITIVTKNPKFTLSLFFGVVIGTQIIVLTAIEHGWMKQLIDLIKP